MEPDWWRWKKSLGIWSKKGKNDNKRHVTNRTREKLVIAILIKKKKNKWEQLIMNPSSHSHLQNRIIFGKELWWKQVWIVLIHFLEVSIFYSRSWNMLGSSTQILEHSNTASAEQRSPIKWHLALLLESRLPVPHLFVNTASNSPARQELGQTLKLNLEILPAAEVCWKTVTYPEYHPFLWEGCSLLGLSGVEFSGVLTCFSPEQYVLMQHHCWAICW